MKRILLLVAIFILYTESSAQSYQIFKTAGGRLENFEAIYDKDELFGYVELVELDKDEALSFTFKYKVLDKNMNTICTGKFKESILKKKFIKDNPNIEYSNGYILFQFIEYFPKGQIITPLYNSFKILNIATNEIVSKGVFQLDDKIRITKSLQETKVAKLIRGFKRVYLSSLEDEGFIMQYNTGFAREYTLLGNDGGIKWHMKRLEEPKRISWNYSLAYYDENYISFLTKKYKAYTKKLGEYLLVLDVKTGNQIALIELSNDKHTFRYSFATTKDNFMTIVGRYFEKHKKDYVGTNESLGLYRRIIDLDNGKIVSEKFLPYGKMAFADISKNGKIKGEGYLDFNKFNENPDGSYFILAETNRKNKYKELYTFIVDKEFETTKIKAYDVERSVGQKYRFSQKLLNDKGRVYFFYDKDSKYRYNLHMIKLDYDTYDLTESQISVDNKESSKLIFPAKTGYIAILERYKKPKEGEKEIELRLERLNF